MLLRNEHAGSFRFPLANVGKLGLEICQLENASGTRLDLQCFEQTLVSGGDLRISIDRSSGRNQYGTPQGKAEDEIWFSSCTAGAISSRGYAAALQAFEAITQGGKAFAWFDRIRSRLAALFGIKGSEIVLSGSGTELEYLALFVARSILPLPLTNLVMAPGETGRGVLHAASGRHFLSSTSSGRTVERGTLLEGLELHEAAMETVEIRDKIGAPLSAEAIDDEVVRKVEANIANNRCVLVHLLECSKTNLSGLRRSTASSLMARYAGRVAVVVDTCQLRCTAEQIRDDLRAGFMVMITGSKFAAGPPFAGALLVPPRVLDQVHLFDLPNGLLSYTSAGDWPDGLRKRMRRQFGFPGNIGVGLRWEAALAELEKLFALPIPFREAVAARFEDAIESHVRDDPMLELVDCRSAGSDLACRTIFPILTNERSSPRPLSSEAIYRSLRQPRLDASCRRISRSAFHVGQPVAIGDRSALRICLSASHVVDAAEKMTVEPIFEKATAPMIADVEALFVKWAQLADEMSRCS